MFVKQDEKETNASPLREVVRPMKLSEAIREGGKTLRDGHLYLQGNGCGCAIAHAVVGYGYTDQRMPWREQFAIVSRHSGMPIRFLEQVEGVHAESGFQSARVVAWLESKGL